MSPAFLCAYLLLAQTAATPPPSKLNEADVAQPPSPPPVEASRDPLAEIAMALDPSRPERERVSAIEALGGSTDERVLSILTTLAQDRSREVSLAAVRALGATRSARAQEALVTIAREPRYPFNAREEAIRAMGVQALENTSTVLGELATESTLPGSLKTLARKQIEARDPTEAAALEPTAPVVTPTRSVDRALPMLVGAGFGGYALWTLGILGQNASGGGLGLVTGAAVGGAAGYLLAPDLTQMQTTFYGVTTGLGTWAGLAIGLGALQGNSDDRFLHLFGVGGELLGATAGYLLWDRFKLTLEAENVKNDSGFALTGALLGAPALHLIASLDDTRQGIDPSRVSVLSGARFFKLMAIGSGLALGGGLGTMVGRAFNDGRGGWLASATAWGLGLGALGSFIAVGNPNFYSLEGAALLGGVAGLGLGFASWTPELLGGDVLTVNTIGAAGAAAGVGLVALLAEGRDNPRAAAAIVAAGAGAGLIGGRLVTRHLSFSGGDTGLIGLSGMHGAFIGALAPDLFGNASGPQRFGGFVLGASAGVLGGGLLAQRLDVPAGTTGTMLMADFFGSITGWGAGLLATKDTAPLGALHAPILVGGTAGLLTTALLSDRLEVDMGDGLLVPVATLIGLWNGAAFAAGTRASDRSVGGATLLGAGLGGLSGIALGQLLTLTPGAVAAAGSGTLWGTYLAMSTLLVTRHSLEDSDLLILLAASDLGLGFTSFLLSPAIGARPEQIGVASLFGVGGAAAAVLTSSLFTRDGDFLLGANLVGAAVGLGIGAVIASGMEERKPAPPGASGSGGGFAGVPIRFQGVSTAPMMDPQGRMSGAAVVALFDND